MDYRGQWKLILPYFGVAGRFLVNKHGPCPICGGRDRFRFDDRAGEGTWICSQCGAGNGFTMLNRLHGWSGSEASKRIRESGILTGVKRQPIPPPDEVNKEKRKQALEEILKGCRRVTAGDPVDLYLSSRKLAPSGTLLFHPGLYEADQKQHLPAMVAKIEAVDGSLLSLHRTFLSKDGRKTRKVMPPIGTITGGSVQLYSAGEVLGLAEGIETALAVCQLFRIPVWSCISAHGLESVKIPKGVKEVVVFGDNDDTFVGQKAAYTLAWKVHRDGIPATVNIPDEEGDDWADVVCRRGRGEEGDSRELLSPGLHAVGGNTQGGGGGEV